MRRRPFPLGAATIAATLNKLERQEKRIGELAFVVERLNSESLHHRLGTHQAEDSERMQAVLAVHKATRQHAAQRKPPGIVLILTDNEVHLWVIDCQWVLASLHLGRAILSQEEMCLMQSFRNTRDQSRFWARRTGLRWILSRYLNISSDQVTYAFGEHRKPCLPTHANPHNLRFNLSHSAELAVVAICRDREIGIDIEKVDHAFDVEEFAQYVFSDRESASLHINPSEKVREFYRIWTRKEALLKAVGTGLVDDLRSAHALEDEVAFASNGSVAMWRVRTIDIAPGYVASVSFAASDAQPRICTRFLAHRSGCQVVAMNEH